MDLKVLVLEKLKQIGGNTRISLRFLPLTLRVKRCRFRSLRKKPSGQLQEHNHFLSKRCFVKKHIIEHAKETLEEIEKLGMEIKLRSN